MTKKSLFSAPAHYLIAVQGRLRPGWLACPGGMQISTRRAESGATVTVLKCDVSNQDELLGILNTLYDLHLPILSVVDSSPKRIHRRERHWGATPQGGMQRRPSAGIYETDH